MEKTFYTLETTYFNNNDSVRYKDTSYYYFSDDTLYNYVKDGTNNSYFPGIPLIFSYEQGEKYIVVASGKRVLKLLMRL